MHLLVMKANMQFLLLKLGDRLIRFITVVLNNTIINYKYFS